MPKTFRIIALSLVGLALLLAIIAIGLGKRGTPAAMPQQELAGGDSAPRQRLTMVVAARKLDTGKPISLSDLKSIEVEQLPAGATSSLYQYDRAIPSRDIAAETPLQAELFLGGLSSQLAAGERAIAIAVDEITGVGNQVVPGDFVDVFVALPENRAAMGGEQEPAAARMIASRLRVLTYGQQSLVNDQVDVAAAPSAAQPSDSSPQDERAQAITARSQNQPGTGSSSRNLASSAVLAVPPDQAGSLLLGAQEGRLFLALRNPTDTSIADRERFAMPGSLLSLPTASGNALQGTDALTADDRAYAGITLKGLTGQRSSQASTRNAPLQAQPVRRSNRVPASSQGVQIIRGSDAPRALTSQ